MLEVMCLNRQGGLQVPTNVNAPVTPANKKSGGLRRVIRAVVTRLGTKSEADDIGGEVDMRDEKEVSVSVKATAFPQPNCCGSQPWSRHALGKCHA